MPSDLEEQRQPGARTISRKRVPDFAFQEKRVADILEPLLAARSSFDEKKLNELIDSIRDDGLINPLVVEKEGDKFRVHAGHRRLVAVRALEWETVWCKVYETGKVPGNAVKHHENKDREDLNPAEEARYFEALLETECGGDVDALCETVRENRTYVENRLLLRRGDDSVFEALEANVIGVGVAQELNMVKDSATRAMYLEAAMQGGASTRMVRDWRIRANTQLETYPEAAAAVPTGEPVAAPVPTPNTMVCALCNSSEDAHEMEFIWLHRSCRRAQERRAASEETGG